MNISETVAALGAAFTGLIKAHPEIMELENIALNFEAIGIEDGQALIEQIADILKPLPTPLKVTDACLVVMASLLSGESAETALACLKTGLTSGLVNSQSSARLWARLMVGGGDRDDVRQLAEEWVKPGRL